MSLRGLIELAAGEPDVLALAAGARQGSPTAEAWASGPITPYLLAALAELEEGLDGAPLLVVTPDDRAARALGSELSAYLAPRRVRVYPSRGTTYESHLEPPPHLVGLRISALDALTAERDAGGPAPIVVAGAVALAERVPDSSLRPGGFAVAVGEEVDLDLLAGLLVEAGYERVDQVADRGQFAIRGGIIDVFGATEDRAARLELFGDEVESIRWFSTFTQRALGEAERIELDPAAELAAEHAADPPFDRFTEPLELIGAEVAVALTAAEEIPAALHDHWQDVTATTEERDARRLYADVDEALERRACLRLWGSEREGVPGFRAAVAVSPARSLAEAEAELERQLRSGYLTVVAFDHLGEGERTAYAFDRLTLSPLPDRPRAGEPRAHYAEATLLDGFVSPALKLAVIPSRRLIHRRPAATPAVARGAMSAFTDLAPGDHVVHADHGVARFEGFETRTLAGVTRDYLKLAYKGDDRVYSPADQLDKITRYVGVGGAEPALSALGGKRWAGVAAKARRAAREMAGELLNLYAERRTRRGHAFPPDGEWQLRLESDFPYRETADQRDAIEAVKADMESEQPMDRLICGDVGYGKTEVALRAAHKAAADARQVMILAPTTILARQHLGTFAERLRDFPYEIEMVSRLRSSAEVRRSIQRFAAGQVDILIGTHRLLSRDVRARELGLLILDEEQRFGVKQKELLRQLKLRVDVLSLSATPIPRTLQMSLAGLRDISVIETPPEGRRPVRTFVGPYEERLVQGAIERELERGGQAFFLHNRVDTLAEEAERLRALVPDARVVEAHGQLPESELEERMLGFVRGEADVLVATTIIESGLDIPAANTLIVERADLLGLAQAYQIRGRVGRSRERAHAYMLYPSEEALSPDAAARLATLADHTELGSGFAIAMRDLELRGAGDLLGAAQSGHVAAVGFELYVEMLDEAVEAMRDGGGGAERPEREARIDLDVDAYVPSEYIPYEEAKIDVHRRIAAARDSDSLSSLRAELRDRFGPEPEPVANLLALQRVRIELRTEGVGSLELRGSHLSVAPIELDSARLKLIREQLPEAIYAGREGTLRLRVESGREAATQRLAAAAAIAEALAASRSG